MTDSFDIGGAFGAEKGYSERFAVYVPNKDRNGQAVPQEHWVGEIMKVLSELCGGATAMPPVRGAWFNPETQSLIFEEPVLVYAFVEPSKFVAGIQKLVDIVRATGRETNQGQVAFEFDNVLYFINFDAEPT